MSDENVGTAQVNTPAEASAPAAEPTVEVPQTTPADTIDLDQLLDTHLTGPEFEQTKHKGIKYDEVIKQLSPEAKKLVQNLREDYRKKTTRISTERNELKARERALFENEQMLNGLKEKMQLPEALDMYNPEHLQKYIEAKAAEQLRNMLQPAQDELRVSKRKAEIDRFRAENPDFDTHKEDIAGLIRDKGLSAEEAYYLVKGRKSREEQEKLNEELRMHRNSAREYGYKVTTGNTPGVHKPKFKSAYEAYLHMKRTGKA
jgi:hypothetical protein